MCNNKSELDYTRIKEEFKNMGKAFPLNEKECVGLTETEKMEITPCGTYCGKCEDYGVVCDGCRNRLGRPIWFKLRMENFMAQNQDLHLEIANTFEENEKFYLNEEHIYLL